MNAPDQHSTALETDPTAADHGLDQDYVYVCRSGQLPDGYVRRFFPRGLELCLARNHGTAYAVSNICTHMACLLSAGKVVEDGIGCSCHGSIFDLDTGEAIYPPATKPITTYPLAEVDSKIFVRVTAADAAAGEARKQALEQARRRAAST
ncbi:MAG: (2Fe-2S)-binding protein [Jatrophihabitans sp.]|nr:MAG: (2Fe-2S)-binding protein [Jatrophihabitans sp.]